MRRSRARTVTAVVTSAALALPLVTLTSPATPVGADAPPGGPYTENFDDDNDTDFSATTAKWNAGLLTLDDASPTYGGVQNNAVQVSGDIGDWQDSAVGDIDGDGNDDLVVVGTNSNRWYSGDGTATPFASTVALDVGSSFPPGVPSDVELVDIEGDGDLDVLVVYPIGNPGLVVYTNDGSANPLDVSPRAIANSIGLRQVKAAFFDDQRGADLVTVGQDVWVFANNGEALPFNGTFPTVVSIDNATRVEVADLNRDGEVDLVVGMDDGGVRYYENQPGGTAFGASQAFELLHTSPSGFAIDALAVGDLDLDGALDIFMEVFQESQSQIVSPTFDASFDFVSATVTDMGLDTNQDVYDVELIDVDTDGDRDIVQVVQDGTSFFRYRWFQNDGTARWWQTQLPTIPSQSNSSRLRVLSMADFDRDGDPDTVISASDSALDSNDIHRYYANDGSPIPIGAQNAVGGAGGPVFDIASLDIDGDGDVDMVTSPGAVANNLVYLNGGGTFPSQVGVAGDGLTTYTYMDVGDFNLDGRPDVAIVGERADPADNRIVLITAPASGGGALVPSFVSAPDAQSVLLADMDRDGRDDLVIGTDGNSANSILFNDGVGTDFFDAAVQLPLPGTNQGFLLFDHADVDRDGRQDLLGVVDGNPGFFVILGSDLSNKIDIGGASHVDGRFFDESGDGVLDVVLRRDTGEISRHRQTPFGTIFESSGTVIYTATSGSYVKVADVTGAGVDGFIVDDGGALFVMTNNGSDTREVDGGTPTNFVAGDFLDDGDIDLIAFTAVGFERYDNASSPAPQSAAPSVDALSLASLAAPTDSVFDLAIGDFDSDNTPEVVSVGTDGVYVSANNSRFVDFPYVVGGRTQIDADATFVQVAVGDVDNDGDDDIVGIQDDGETYRWRNDGGGTFFRTLLSFTGATSAEELQLADINDDGNLDIVALFFDGGNYVIRTLNGTGAGGFPANATTLVSSAQLITDFVLFDGDADGDLDLATATNDTGQPYYLNNGSGTFALEQTLTTFTDDPHNVAAGDFNNDGFADLVFGVNSTSTAAFEYSSVGGGFTGAQAVAGSFGSAQDVALADVDGDGQLDLVTSVSDLQPELEIAYGDGTALFNAQSQIVDTSGSYSGPFAVGEIDSTRGAEVVAIDSVRALFFTVQQPQLLNETANQARSTTADNPADTADILSATISLTPVVPNEIDTWLSNDGGTTWFEAEHGVELTFPTTGSDLRWRSQFTNDRLADSSSDPRQALADLEIAYTLFVAPPSPTIDVSLSAVPDVFDAGPSVVPLGALSPEVIQEGEGDEQTGSIAAAPLASIDLTDAPANTNVAASPLASLPLASLPLASLPLASIPLTDVPVDAPGGWDGIIQRARDNLETQLVGAPLQNVTLADVADLSEVQSLPLGSIDLGATPLGSLPLASIALADLPLASIRVGPSADPLDDWCDLLESPELGYDCLADFGIVPGTPDDTNLVDLAVEGVPLASLPLASIPLGSLPLASLPLGSIPLASIDVAGTPLASIPLASIPLASLPLASLPLASIPLASLPLASLPLASIQVDGQNVAATPLASLDIAASPLASLPLASLPLASLPLASLPLASIPLASLPLASLDLATVTVAGTPLASLPLASLDIAASPLASIPLASIDVATTPLASIPLASLPLASLPLASIPLASIPLASLSPNALPLASLPLASIDIANTPLASIPLASLDTPDAVVDCGLIDCGDPRNTLFQALLNGVLRGDAEFDDLAGGLGGIRHDDIAGAITGITREQYEADLLAALNDPGQLVQTLADLVNNGTLDDLELGDLPESLNEVATTPFGALLAGLAGLNYDALGAALADVVLPAGTAADILDFDDLILGELEDTANGFNTPFFQGITLNDLGNALFDLRLDVLADLFGIDLAQLEADLAPNLTGDLDDLLTFEGMTLGDLLGFEGTTLGELFAALTPPNSTEGIFDDIFLGDLLVGLLAVADYPWSDVDFDADDLLSIDDTSVNIEYTALVQTTDAAGETGELRVTLPADSPYIEGSTELAGTPFDEPELQGNDVVWTFDVTTAPENFLITFEARPPLTLATHPAEATARLLNSSIEASSLGSFTLQEANEPNDEVIDATPVVEDNAYFAHITSADDIDLFAVSVPAVGSRLSINLSNLDADLDLALYAPAGGASLGADPVESIVPVEDDGINALGNDDEVDAELAQDLMLSDLPLHQTSLQRGLDDEQIDTAPLNRAGTWIIQVAGFNGAITMEPYVLRAKVLPPIDGAVCDARTFQFNGVAGAPVLIGASHDTLLLVNEQRLGSLYGPAEAAAIRTRLDDMVRSLTAPLPTDADLTGLGINPVVVPVESDADVAAAYAAWDQADAACSPDAANAVVDAISGIVETARATADIEHVVVIGGDELIPFARVPDATTIANERSYANTFSGINNALVGALAGGFVLTDDVYGDADPIAFGDRTLFVPDIAVGRLVESPADIIEQLDQFLGHGGTLDPDTALVTGYDFLTDGADAISAGLQGALTDANDLPLQPDELINDVWGRADLADALVPGVGDGPDVASVNAHFDHYRALPADGNATQDESDLFEVVDLGQGAPGGLAGSIVFSMGCHSGFAVNDELVPAGDVRAGDWAQNLAARGAIYVGNTGYGYGDTEIVAYSEELMTQFAGNLDGSVTAGQALMFAKNAYIGSLGAVGVYDEKSAMQATFYGLPFYVIDETAPPPPPEPVIETEPAQAAGLTSSRVVIDETYTQVPQGPDSPDGTYWFFDDNGVESTRVVHSRPIQPSVVRDITAADDAIEARGAFLVGLESIDVGGVDPVIVRPTIDLGANEPEPDVGEIADPSVLQAVRSELTPEGERQNLVVSGGQFRGTAELGVERLFPKITADVYYTDDDAPDRTPPVIGTIDGIDLGTDVNVTATVTDADSDVVRVNMLFVIDPQPGITQTWQSVEFGQVPGTDTWTGAIADINADIEYFVQAVDAAGNVAVSSDKGSFYTAAAAAPPPPEMTPIVEPVLPASGWYDTPADVSITDQSPFTVNVSVNGAAPVAYADPISIGTSGNNRVVFTRNDGLVAEIFVPVDLDDPGVAITSPGTAPIPSGSDVTVRFTCSDAGSGIESCTAMLDDDPVDDDDVVSGLADGGHSLVVTATDIAGNVTTVVRNFTLADLTAPDAQIITPADGTTIGIEAVTSTVADYACIDPPNGVVPCSGLLDGTTTVLDGEALPPLGLGQHTIVLTATDAGGNVGTDTSTFTVADLTAPTITFVTPAPGDTLAFGVPITVDVDCADNVGVTGCAITINGSFVADGATYVPDTLGANTIAATATDAAGNSFSDSAAFTVTDQTAPTLAITSPVDGDTYPFGEAIPLTIVCVDVNDPAPECTTTVDGEPVGTGELVGLSLGEHTVALTATDSSGNTSGPVTVTFTVVDETLPTISVVSPAPGLIGQSEIATVTAQYECTDAESGIDETDCTASIDGTPVADGGLLGPLAIGPHVFTANAVDLAGNAASTTVNFSVVDDLAPEIEFTTPMAGDLFDQGEPIVLDFDCNDPAAGDVAGSGIASCTAVVLASAVETVVTDGQDLTGLPVGDYTLRVTAIDQAGLTTMADAEFGVVDITDPTVTITAPLAAPPSGQMVTFQFSCDDDIDGSAVSCVGLLDGTQAVTDGQTLTLSRGMHSLFVLATDAARNAASATRTFEVIDLTPPTITVTAPLAGAVIESDVVVSAAYDCTEAPDSGVASCTALLDGVTPVMVGDALVGLSIGTHQLVVTAVNLDGTVATLTVDFEVVEPAVREILFIANSVNPPPRDTDVIQLLRDEGYDVELVDDDQFVVDDYVGKDLVVVSSSIKPFKIGTRLRDALVPVVTWEAYLHDDMGFAFQNQVGRSPTNTKLIDVIDPSHPIAAGFSGLTTVLDSANRLSRATVQGDATVIATVPNRSGQAAVFAYEAGAAMRNDLVAPARRVGLFMDYFGAGQLSDEGETIVLAAVDWALSGEPINRPPIIDVDDEITVDVAGGAAIDATVADDGLLTSNLSFAWTQVSGPGTATFSTPGAEDTDVSFSEPGLYRLELSVDDGELTTVEQITVTVTDLSAGDTIMLVVNRRSAPAFPDRVLRDHFQSLGFTVVVIDDDDIASDPSLVDIDLVYVSATVNPSKVGNFFTDVAIPLITSEHLLLDDLGMGTGAFGFTPARRTMTIVDDTHPLAAGLSGVVRYLDKSSRIGFGQPAASADVVGTVAGKSVLFMYDAGTPMVGFDAPANRVFFPSSYATPRFLNFEGLTLLTTALYTALEIPDSQV